MAFTVQLFSFSKKENSTARPSSNSATSFNCKLLAPSGVLNPAIELNLGLNNSPSNYNYAYIPSFNRYYWIEEWTNKEPLWVASLKVDALATYKSEIGNTNLYVLRASNQYDGNIIDTMYPTKITNTKSKTYSNPSTFIPSRSIADGMFVIGVVSTGANFGSIQYYALKHNAFASLVSKLLDDSTLTTNGFSNDDCQLALQKSLIDPLSYIKSCVFVPYSYDDYSGSARTTLNIWDWSLSGIPNKVVLYNNFAVALPDCTITLPKHPQTNSRGVYANVSPYTEMSLLVNPFGEITIDTTKVYNAESIMLVTRMDITTGEAVMNIVSGDYNLSRLFTKLGVPITLSQVTTDILGQATNTISSVSNFLTSAVSGNVGGMVASVTNGIANGVLASQPRQYSTGEQGGFIKLYSNPVLYTSFYTLVDDDITSHGRPLCKVIKPNSIGGYMLIQDADISISGTSRELSIIRGYLEGGFYYE